MSLTKTIDKILDLEKKANQYCGYTDIECQNERKKAQHELRLLTIDYLKQMALALKRATEIFEVFKDDKIAAIMIKEHPNAFQEEIKNPFKDWSEEFNGVQ